MNTMPLGPYRIAPLMDKRVFELPDKAPRTTTDGAPWLRWANVGEHSGWYSIGTRRLDPVGSPTQEANDHFWSAVYTLASEVGNGCVDAVHCLGPGVLSVGGLGVTVSSGYGQALLTACLRQEPLWWLGSMAQVIHESKVALRHDVRGVGSAALFRTGGGALFSQEELDLAVRGGSASEKWTGAQKRLSFTWVECVSSLLRHAEMDPAQVQFCAAHVPDLIPGLVRERIAWPSNGIEDSWMWTIEQRALWAAAMVLVLEDEVQATTLIERGVKLLPQDARASLVELSKLAREQDGFTDTFRDRVLNTVRRVQEVFTFTLEAT